MFTIPPSSPSERLLHREKVLIEGRSIESLGTARSMSQLLTSPTPVQVALATAKQIEGSNSTFFVADPVKPTNVAVDTVKMRECLRRPQTVYYFPPESFSLTTAATGTSPSHILSI